MTREVVSVMVDSSQQGLNRQAENLGVDFLHEIGSRMAAADPMHDVLNQVVDFVSSLVKCDSCFIYILTDTVLILRASMNTHPEVVDRLRIRVGQGVAGWVAEHREPVVLPSRANEDPRFHRFRELAEDCYEALLSVPLLSRGRIVGVINVQHRLSHQYTPREIRLISTLGFLIGAEVELARLESENVHLNLQLETRKLVERAKGILQSEFGLSEEAAYLSLQRQCRQRRKSMKEVAEAVILSEDLKRYSLSGDCARPTSSARMNVSATTTTSNSK
jgi:uroporphyrinogen-III synthase